MAQFFSDYNIMAPDEMDDLLFSPFQQALGVETFDRIQRQLDNYEYYDGKQYRDEFGNLVKAEDLERPYGVDYDPTQYATNYFKAFVDRKARWQMGGKHGVKVPRRQIDDPSDMADADYEPSPKQQRENDRAEDYEKLMMKLWNENKMRSKLLKAARDRMISDRVVCKIVFNERTGQMRWVFRPDTEYVPVYSDDDFEELIAANFIKRRKEWHKKEEIDAVQIQRFTFGEDGMAYLEEKVYRESNLKLIRTIVDNAPLGLDFIPVVEIPVNELISETEGESEISALKEQNDMLNQMNGDAIDSMKFEMFPITSVENAKPGAAEGMQVAPGALVEVRGASDTHAPTVKKVESGFRWKEAFDDQYKRIKSAMHEVSGLPHIIPQDLNFGGLNGEALQVLFHDIISDTEEHWITWNYCLAELHEKSVRYLQTLSDRGYRIAYDKKVLNAIGDDYENEMNFVLPLPDNRKDLVELLESETLAGFESTRGAIERLGVENVQDKIEEIESESNKQRKNRDPYGESQQSEDETEEDEDDPEGGEE